MKVMVVTSGNEEAVRKVFNFLGEEQKSDQGICHYRGFFQDNQHRWIELMFVPLHPMHDFQAILESFFPNFVVLTGTVLMR